MNVIGNGGGSLGYDPIPGCAMAIEVDFQREVVIEPPVTHVALMPECNSRNHREERRLNTLGIEHSVRVMYDGSFVDVWHDDLLQFRISYNVSQQLPGGVGYVGFTAATGSLPELHESM